MCRVAALATDAFPDYLAGRRCDRRVRVSFQWPRYAARLGSAMTAETSDADPVPLRPEKWAKSISAINVA